MFQDEKIVETKICRHCSCQFYITDKDLEFYEKVSPFFSSPSPSDISLSWGGIKEGVLNLWNGKIKYLIPTPNLCPECRQQRRLSFRNERNLYKRKCDFSGREIISIYSPDKNYKVYDQEIWWSDKWDALDYGREFDLSRSFFEQFWELTKVVPRMSLYKDISCENCDFANQITKCKDSYLIISCSEAQECLYGKRVNNSINCVDCFLVYRCNNCYEWINIFSCHNCFYVINSNHCHQSYFLYDCDVCENCILCTNLKNKSFCIENIQYSREEYEQKKKKILGKNSLSSLKNQFNILLKKAIHKNLNLKNCENVVGNDVQNWKNSYFVFDSSNIENIKYGQFIQDTDTSYDLDYNCCDSSLSYEISTWWVNMFKCLFSVDAWPDGNNLLYCDSCSSSSYLFWCVWLRNKSYCILNKQYTKEEYEKLVPKIIEFMSSPQPSPEREGGIEWWEFFPASLSLFWYNETLAQEYFPINPPVLADIPLIKGDSQSGAEAGGFSSKIEKLSITQKTGLKWEINYIDREWNIYNTIEEAWERPVFKYSTYEAPFPKVEKIIPANKLPENISEIPDDILNWAIECEITKKPFRIVKQELDFYRKHNLPIPKKHPDQRHLERMTLRNPRKLFTRICDKCGKEIQTTYAPERSEIVYCQDCYEKEIY
jgi:CxxC-x17-CxxC domain-containing protein